MTVKNRLRKILDQIPVKHASAQMSISSLRMEHRWGVSVSIWDPRGWP